MELIKENHIDDIDFSEVDSKYRYLRSISKKFREEQAELFINCASLVKEDMILKFKLGEHRDNIGVLSSHVRMAAAINSYIDDIGRYKDYHDMEIMTIVTDQQSNLEWKRVLHKKVNHPKFFAYMTKWIMKFQPFFIHYTDSFEIADDYADDLFEMDSSINQRVLFTWFNLAISTNFPDSGGFQLDDQDKKFFLYQTKYREVNVGSLEHFFSRLLPKEV